MAYTNRLRGIKIETSLQTKLSKIFSLPNLLPIEPTAEPWPVATNSAWKYEIADTNVEDAPLVRHYQVAHRWTNTPATPQINEEKSATAVFVATYRQGSTLDDEEHAGGELLEVKQVEVAFLAGGDEIEGLIAQNGYSFQVVT